MRGVVLSRSRFFCVVACAALVALAGCSSGGDSGKALGGTAVKTDAGKVAALKLGYMNVESVGTQPNLDAKTKQQMLQGAQTYLDSAVGEPLATGKVGAKFAELFEADLRNSATVTDASALTEAPIGKVETFNVTGSPVAVSGLADVTGALIYLSTKFDVNVKATKDNPITLKRSVELTWAPTGPGWSVTAYRVLATRKVGGTTTTTNANSGSTP